MDSMSFLDSIAGYVGNRLPEAKARIGTIDPAFVVSAYPATLPKVTFDGESTLSGKRYPVVGEYFPRAGDRVILLPVGGTYVIAGAVNVYQGYTAVSFQNSWKNYGGVFETCKYTRLPNGFVHLTGIADGSTSTGDVIFTLPAGYRPSGTLHFATTADNVFGDIVVAASGVVEKWVGPSTWVSLDTVRFLAA